MISVVIPAHNEEQVIGRCLRTLLDDGPDDLEVVVVANGCSDRTAALAAAHGPQVQVLETPVASKVGALNLGDAHVTGFPRLYLDADVELSGSSARATADALRAGRGLAAAPAVRFAFSDRPWHIRAYYQVWSALPFAQEGVGTGGVYALSALGRARFDAFPDLGADDLFIREQFAAHERVRVADAEVVVHPPLTLRSLVRIRARVLAANREYAALGFTVGPDAGVGGRLRALRARPALWPSAAWYVAVQCAARLWSRRLGSGPRAWDRDETSRNAANGPLGGCP